MAEARNTLRDEPGESGHFGLFGGRFVAETLMPLIHEVEQAYEAASGDPAFTAELEHFRTSYAGRPSPLRNASAYACLILIGKVAVMTIAEPPLIACILSSISSWHCIYGS